MAEELTTAQPIEIRFGNVDLVTKLDVLGAAIAAVREAHRDQIPDRCWQELHLAQEAIVRAMFAVNKFPAPEEHTMRLIAKQAITTNTTPAEEGKASAGPGDVTHVLFIDEYGDTVRAEFSGRSFP